MDALFSEPSVLQQQRQDDDLADLHFLETLLSQPDSEGFRQAGQAGGTTASAFWGFATTASFPPPATGTNSPTADLSSWIQPAARSEDLTVDSLLEGDWDDWKGWGGFDWGDAANTSATVAPTPAQAARPPPASLLGSSAFDFSLLLDSTLPTASSVASPPWYPTPQSPPGASNFVPGSAGAVSASVRSPSLQSILEEPATLALPPRSNTASSEFAETALPSDAVHQSSPYAASSESRKRKSISTTPAYSGSEDGTRGASWSRKRIQHGKVEKRYRMRLQEKIAALRDCVPDLRGRNGSRVDSSDDDDGPGLGQKLNKGAVMEKARDYILKLEEDVRKLSADKRELLDRLDLIKRVVPAMQPVAARGGNTLSRLVLAILAGAMTTESFHTTQQSTSSPGGRGLFAVPTWILGPAAGPAASPLRHLTFVAPSLGSPVLLAKLFVFFGAIVYLIWPGIFAVKPPPQKAKQTLAGALVAVGARGVAGSNAARYVFATAKQSVWIPDGLLLEIAAIALKLFKLALHRLGVTWLVYSRLANTPQESEAVRVKAWDLAVDGQLCGGDEQVNSRRLLLSLVAVMTLPETPRRRMLMALNAAILRQGFRGGFFGARWAGALARRASRSSWNRAQEIQHHQDHQDDLPRQLRALLQLDAEDALSDAVAEKAYRMTWRLASTSHGRSLSENVADGASVGSPLDAVAAWWAASALRTVHAGCLATQDDSDDHYSTTRILERALRIAPPGSVVFAYGMATSAVLSCRNQTQHCAVALRAAASTPAGSSRAALRADLALGLRAAMATALLGQPEADKALRALAGLAERTAAQGGVALLGGVALCRFVAALMDRRSEAERNRVLLERLAGVVRVWTGAAARAGRRGREERLTPAAERKAVRLCLRVFKWLVGMDGANGEAYCSN